MSLFRGWQLGHPLPQKVDKEGGMWLEDTVKAILKEHQDLNYNPS